MILFLLHFEQHVIENEISNGLLQLQVKVIIIEAYVFIEIKRVFCRQVAKSLRYQVLVLILDSVDIDFNNKVLQKHLSDLGINVKFYPSTSVGIISFSYFNDNPAHYFELLR